MKFMRKISLLVLPSALFLAMTFFSAGAGAQSDDSVRLKNRTVTPKAPAIGIKAMSLRETPGVKRAMILQFVKKLSTEEHKGIAESGIELESYLGSNAYVAVISKALDLEKPAVNKLIRGIEPFKSLDKLSLEIVRKKVPQWAILEKGKKNKILVEFFRFVDRKTIETELKRLGLSGRRFSPHIWSLSAAPGKIEALSARGTVKQVKYGPIPFLPLNDTGRRVAETNQAQLPSFPGGVPQYGGVTGTGVQIGIADSGVDGNHNDFGQINAAGNAFGTRVYNGRPGSGSHGTHVASIAAGNGFQSANNNFPAFSLRGHAPQAGIGDYPQLGADVDAVSDAIRNDGTDVTNNSYVQSMTVYDGDAAALDEIVRGDATDGNGNLVPARPQVWAAGNNGTGAQYGNEEGYFSVFTTAKNTISVGSVDTLDQRLSDYSSLGPTFDGRIKPDIVAPGCIDSISSPSIGIQAASSGTQGYTGKCGTSMAAPVVAGIVGQMMQRYQITFGVAPTLLPATYKAILVHTARDMVKTGAFPNREFNNPDTGNPVLYHAGPDFATGFGLVDADAASKVISESARWTESEIGTVGQTINKCIQVPPGAKNVKAVLAWDDEPGSTLTAETVAKLVNDLDLSLIAPDSTTYKPWTPQNLPMTANPGDGALDPIATADVTNRRAKRGDDRVNNVEMASVPFPKPGFWKVRIRAHALPNGNVQPFSLVSSHKFVSSLKCTYKVVGGGKPICNNFSWLCDQKRVNGFKIIDDQWVIPPKGSVFIPEICKYVRGVEDCPGCSGKGWEYCPAWNIQINGLPSDAVVRLFNEDGKVVLVDKSRQSPRRLKLQKRRPGDNLAMVFTNAGNDPYSKPLRLGIKIRPGK